MRTGDGDHGLNFIDALGKDNGLGWLMRDTRQRARVLGERCSMDAAPRRARRAPSSSATTELIGVKTCGPWDACGHCIFLVRAHRRENNPERLQKPNRDHLCKRKRNIVNARWSSVRRCAFLRTEQGRLCLKTASLFHAIDTISAPRLAFQSWHVFRKNRLEAGSVELSLQGKGRVSCCAGSQWPRSP